MRVVAAAGAVVEEAAVAVAAAEAKGMGVGREI